ncbi:UNVERIFIED_CONTAM: hypothetical protein Sradi_4405300 [Sesamum radiatum]|uniref:DDE Tnp4 domain-containing protein n=1 Tax=Sesamum radiatum TaxID=300843 RepID=A0AAW2NQF9_SESRA
MDRNAICRLCQLLETSAGLHTTRNLTVSEQVAIFLSVLAHQKKNCAVRHDFIRSSQTISKHFHSVLRAVLRLQPLLLPRPTPIGDECQDSRWRWFKIITIFVTNGYADSEGFLNPFHRVRYHFKEWNRGGGEPQTAHELFNLRHAAARNVIERSFELLKTRWGILRSPSYYSIDVQNRIIVACCLLHNCVRLEMPEDPIEGELHEDPNNAELGNTKYVSSIKTSTAWTAWREELATNMYAEWQRS